MKRLISEISKRITRFPECLANDPEFDSDEFLDSYVAEHQRQLPGSWQHWNIEKRASEIAAQLNRAFLVHETSIGRIIERFAR